MLHYAAYESPTADPVQGRLDVNHSYDALLTATLILLNLGYEHVELTGHSGILLSSATKMRGQEIAWDVEPQPDHKR